MSIPFMCGAGPSSFTVPVILPSPAALTPWLRINAAEQTRTIADSTTARLYRFLIESPLVKRTAKILKLVLMLFLLLSRRSIWINRFQGELFRHFLFLAFLGHESSQIENQVPSLVGFDVVGKRRHGSAIQPGHEDPVNIQIGVAALRPRPVGKVEGCDRTAEIILKGRGGRSVGHALHTVALPALHPGKHIAPRLDALGGDLRLGRNLDGRSWFFAGPARGEVLRPSYQVGALLPA